MYRWIWKTEQCRERSIFYSIVCREGGAIEHGGKEGYIIVSPGLM